MKILAVLLLMLALPAPVAAQDELSAADRSCLDEASSNRGFARCSQSIIDSEDARLNAVWRLTLASLGGSASERGGLLLDEQRAWIAFREAACQHWLVPGSGREAQVLHGPLCIAGVIKDRADELVATYASLSPDNAARIGTLAP